jgi:hypothetical protein
LWEWQEPLDHKEQLVQQEQQDRQVLPELPEQPESQVLLALSEQQVHKAFKAMWDQLD